MNLNFLSPMIDLKTNKLVFMDFESSVVYEPKIQDQSIHLEKIQTDTSCFDDFIENQQVPSEVPYDLLSQVFNTEKELAEKTTQHIFRREM
jgi:S-adenosylmethionine synthetase